MVETIPAAVFGVHAAIAGFFIVVAVAGLLDGAAPAAAGVRFVIGALVLALGIVVTRIVRRR